MWIVSQLIQSYFKKQSKQKKKKKNKPVSVISLLKNYFIFSLEVQKEKQLTHGSILIQYLSRIPKISASEIP